MGAELSARNSLRTNDPAAAGAPSRSPLAVKKPRPRGPDAEASLCAIKIAREAVRASDQRVEPREESSQPVGLAFRGDEAGGSVVNISTTGAKVACAMEPFIGERLELTFPDGERIDGVVRWVRDGHIGVEFGDDGRSSSEPPVPSSPETQPQPPPLRRLDVAKEEPGPPAAAAPAPAPADPAPAPTPEGAADAEQGRNFKRARVLLAAKLTTSRGVLDARLRDLSCKGALLECGEPLRVGEAVVFTRGTTVVPARIAWTSGERIGLEFDRAIEESEVMTHINRAPTLPSYAPKPVQEFRRPSFNDRLSDYDRKLARVIGSSLGVSLTDE